MRKEIIIAADQTYGNLRAKWCWKTSTGERIWKCNCLICGQSVYVKERGLLLNLADDCGEHGAATGT